MQFSLSDQVCSKLKVITEDDNDFEEIYARVAWSCVIEPGDQIAGLLISYLGAAASYRFLLQSEAQATKFLKLLSGNQQQQLATELSIKKLAEALNRWQPRLNPQLVTRSIDNAQKIGARLITPDDQHWPKQLSVLDYSSPLVLWVRGNQAQELVSDSIAIVGSRAATGYGEYVATELSNGLVERGFSIVSGAAYGIDAVAHRAALAAAGKTIAVLAGGVDRLYPSGHESLLHQIMQSGVVLSEVPIGAAPTRWRFLQRNRLIAALAKATVVVEAGWRSGSLNTAHHAISMGLPVGVVPGPITSASSTGCHKLLRDTDAICVTNAAEVTELARFDGFAAESDSQNLLPEGSSKSEAKTIQSREPANQTRLIDALSKSMPKSSTQLAIESGLTLSEVQSLLGGFAVIGRVTAANGNWLLSKQKPKSAEL